MKGVSIALLSCMFLALESIFSKTLLAEMSPLVLTALTSVSTAIITFLILEGEQKMKAIWRLKKKDFMVLLAISIISGIVAQLLYVTGLRDSTATNAILITRLNSLLIAVMGVLLIREKPTWNHLLGGLLMIFGVVTISTKGFTDTVSLMRGDGLLILAAFFWATANILMKKYLSHVEPEVIVIGYYGFSGAVLVGIAANQIPATITVKAVELLIAQVLLVGVAGRYLWYYSFEHTTAYNVGLASLSMPFFGVVYAIIFLRENLLSHQLLGGLLILAGLTAIEYHEIRKTDIEHRLKRHHPHH